MISIRNEILGIPFDTVQQVCLTPVAYTLGTSFRPALGPDPEDVIHWDGWEPDKPMPHAGQLLGQPPPTSA